MWLFTPTGYYSAVMHRKNHDSVMVRCRAKLHAERLVDFFEKDKPALEETPPPADYRWRVTITKRQWAEFVAYMSLQIEYDNFKNDAGKQTNPNGYVTSLHRVWDVMSGFQDDQHPDERKRWASYTTYTGKYGGTYSSAMGKGEPLLDDDIPFPHEMLPITDTERIVIDAIDGERGRGETEAAEDIVLGEGTTVRIKSPDLDEEDLGDGEIVSIDLEKREALVRFFVPIQLANGNIEPEEVTAEFDLDELEAVQLSPNSDRLDKMAEELTGISMDTPTFDSLDAYEWNGDWPEPMPAGFLKGR